MKENSEKEFSHHEVFGNLCEDTDFWNIMDILDKDVHSSRFNDDFNKFDNFNEEVKQESFTIDSILCDIDQEIIKRNNELSLIDNNISETENLLEKLECIWSKKIHGSNNDNNESSNKEKKVTKKKKPKLLPQKPLYYRLTDGSFVRIICPSCKRDKFANQLGFVNHCRIVHKLKFSTYEDAAKHCGISVDESEVPYDDPSRHDISLTHIVGYKKSSSEYQQSNIQQNDENEEVSRFYTKKKIIIGNTSKLIKSSNGKVHYKWLLYVKSKKGDDSSLSSFISKVRFFLPPFFKPNDIVEIRSLPFYLIREGSDEFPVRVQIHFIDPKNKPTNIIYDLKFNHNSVFQSKGNEIEVDIELDKYYYDKMKKLLNNNNDNDENIKDDDLNNKTPSSDQSKNDNSIDNDENESFLMYYNIPYYQQRSFGNITESDIQRFIRVEAEKTYPLISEEFVGKLPYSVSKSHAEWYSWSHGKRKSSEWQRASRLRLLLEEKLNVKKTTKEIIDICNKLSMTPAPPSSKFKNCDPFDNPWSFESLYIVPMIQYRMEALSKASKKHLSSKICYCRFCGSTHFPVDRFDYLELQCGRRTISNLNTWSSYDELKEKIKSGYFEKLKNMNQVKPPPPSTPSLASHPPNTNVSSSKNPSPNNEMTSKLEIKKDPGKPPVNQPGRVMKEIKPSPIQPNMGGPLLLPKGIQPILNGTQRLNIFQQQLMSISYSKQFQMYQKKQLELGQIVAPFTFQFDNQLLLLLSEASDVTTMTQEKFMKMVNTLQGENEFQSVPPRKKRGRTPKSFSPHKDPKQRKIEEPKIDGHQNCTTPLTDQGPVKIFNMFKHMGLDLGNYEDDDIVNIMLHKLFILFSKKLLKSSLDAYTIERYNSPPEERPMKVLMPLHVAKAIMTDFDSFGILTNEGIMDPSIKKEES